MKTAKIEDNMHTCLGVCQLMLKDRAREFCDYCPPQQGSVTSEDISAVISQVCGMPSFAHVDRTALQQHLEERCLRQPVQG